MLGIEPEASTWRPTVDPEPNPHALVPDGGRVAILRALPGLGDLLCAVPALRALRRARPDVEVTCVGLPETEALVGRYPAYVDRFLAFPGFPGLPDRRPDLKAIPRFLVEAQARQFDLAIQLHGSGAVSNLVTQLLGARRCAGHVEPAGTPPDRATFLPWHEGCSEIRRSLRLMAHLGWPSDDERLEFEIAPGTVAPVDGAYVVVHPGASSAAKRWTAHGFRDVARALADQGQRVVLTGGAREAERTAWINESLDGRGLDLAGRTTLDELAATVRGARLVVANDTGVAHLAVAVGVPSVVVFTRSDHARWAPLDTTRHRVVPGSARRVVSEARRLLAAGELSDAA